MHLISARNIILLIFFIAYVMFTINNRKFIVESILYSKTIKRLHLVLIWLIPFVWIWLLKALDKSTPGSYHFPHKEDPEPNPGDNGPFHSSGPFN